MFLAQNTSGLARPPTDKAAEWTCLDRTGGGKGEALCS
ncbi:hypothetical protein PoMZ_09660 [Pyricularia oryzae]|nr:hypothetical protein PoMZ_09660 [Pyricularia oryzae]